MRWKWVTIYPCTRWLGLEWRKQRCSGNPSWLSAGTKLLEGKGPLLLGLAFLTLSSTSLSSTWLVSEESLVSTNARLPFVHGNMGHLTVSLLCCSLIKVKLGGNQGPSQSCGPSSWTTESSTCSPRSLWSHIIYLEFFDSPAWPLEFGDCKHVPPYIRCWESKLGFLTC